MTIGATASPYAAAGVYRGFTLQDVRLAFHLITVPSACSVSIEHADDIAMHYADGGIVYEQVKSAPKSEPLRDTAPEFWKTLANWGKVVTSASAATTRRFQLYVVPPREGNIAKLVHAANSDADADAVIMAADALLKSAGKTVVTQIKRFRALPLDTQRYVIRNTTILNTDEDEYIPIRKHMGEGVVLVPGVVAQASRYIIGAAQTRARKLMAAGLPAMLSGDEFKAELQAFVRRTNMQRLLPSASETEEAKAAMELVARPVFIRQLELVDATREQQIAAAADYLQACASKASWATDGLVLESSLERWDKALTSAHSSYQMRVAVEHRSTPTADRGRVLLSHCCTHSEKLDADDVGQEFVRGSFHSLAERKRVGWHDDYKLHLEGDE